MTVRTPNKIKTQRKNRFLAKKFMYVKTIVYSIKDLRRNTAVIKKYAYEITIKFENIYTLFSSVNRNVRNTGNSKMFS